MGVPSTRETGVRSMSTLLVGRGSWADPKGEASRVSIDNRVWSFAPCKKRAHGVLLASLGLVFMSMEGASLPRIYIRTILSGMCSSCKNAFVARCEVTW